jgi:DNA-directed RNA polymerase specialized sigma24 family protein
MAKNKHRRKEKEIEMEHKALQALDAIDEAETEEARLEAAALAIPALQSLPPEQREEVARREFLRFKKFIAGRVARGGA